MCDRASLMLSDSTSSHNEMIQTKFQDENNKALYYRILLELFDKYGIGDYNLLAQNKDRNFILKSVEISGYMLNFIDPRYLKEKEVVMIAVKNDGLALRFADATLQDDKQIVLQAVSKYGFAIEHASEAFVL